MSLILILIFAPYQATALPCKSAYRFQAVPGGLIDPTLSKNEQEVCAGLATLDKLLDDYRPQFSICYEEALKTEPGLGLAQEAIVPIIIFWTDGKVALINSQTFQNSVLHPKKSSPVAQLSLCVESVILKATVPPKLKRIIYVGYLKFRQN